MNTDSKLKLLEVIAKSWTDSRYKEDLLKNPQEVLAQAGVEVRSLGTIRVIEQSPDEVFLILPPKPAGELTIQNVTSQIAASVPLTINSPMMLTIFGGPNRNE